MERSVLMSDEGLAITTPLPPSLIPPKAPDPITGEGMKVDRSAPLGVNKDGSPKRPRGRPPGSRNRPKEGQEPIRGGTTRVTPPPRTSTTPPAADKPKIDKEERNKRIEEIASKITGDLNDNIFSVLIAGTGIPAGLIFKAGQAPVKFAENDHLTQLGQMFAIPGDVAEYWARVYVTFSETDTGKKMTSSVEGGNVGLILAALMALAATIRWGQQVAAGMNTVRQFQEYAAQQAQAATVQQPPNPYGAPSEPPQ
jgi:hypothetical protein